MLSHNYYLGLYGIEKVSCNEINFLADGSGTSFSMDPGTKVRASEEATVFYDGLRQACKYRDIALSFGIFGLSAPHGLRLTVVYCGAYLALWVL